MGRHITPTFFYDQNCCKSFGIDGLVQWFARNLGIEKFLCLCMRPSFIKTPNTLKENELIALVTYHQLIIEFLSTYMLQTMPSKKRGGKEKVVGFSFCMFNEEHSIIVDKVNRPFGWDPTAESIDFMGSKVTEYSEDNWWLEITDGLRRFSSKNSRSSKILHAAIRYYIGYFSLHSSLGMRQRGCLEWTCIRFGEW